MPTDSPADAGGLFELDAGDDVMPGEGSDLDTYFELDDNDDIEPEVS